MNNSIYKYLPVRESFFDNFLLRASNRLSLNDPFESSPSADFLADFCIQINYLRFGNTREEIIDFISKQPEDSLWAELDIPFYKQFGIISFTECNDNLLMWAHYSKDHQGLVIEFDTTHKFFNNQFEAEKNKFIGSLTRVVYRKARLDKVGDNLLEPYFHKSDEWHYEKEHRLILPLSHPEKILLSKEHFNQYVKKRILSENDGVEFDGALIEIINNKHKTNNDPAALSMFEIPRECIKSVTFGCRATEGFIDSVKNKIISNDLLSHVEIYKAKKDKIDYRLRFEKLI